MNWKQIGIGTRVRIKKEFPNTLSVRTLMYNSDMTDKAGDIFTIARIDNHNMGFNFYKLKEDNENWSWSEDMFEVI